MYRRFIARNNAGSFLGRYPKTITYWSLQYENSCCCQRSRSIRGWKYARGTKFGFLETVRLDHQRIALSDLVIPWAVQPTSPLVSLDIFPAKNVSLMQSNILHLP